MMHPGTPNLTQRKANDRSAWLCLVVCLGETSLTHNSAENYSNTGWLTEAMRILGEQSVGDEMEMETSDWIRARIDLRKKLVPDLA